MCSEGRWHKAGYIISLIVVLLWRSLVDRNGWGEVGDVMTVHM